ncbi:MAG: ATP-binding cassette domain-containing protein, partial [Verrucomicrobiota bacterium]
MSAPSHPAGLAVSVRGLRKQFGDLVVLPGLDLQIAAGELFVLMGPSGSGKSTFLRQLIGLETPDAGEIHLDGELLSEDSQSHHRLAMVFQSGGLL